MINPEGSGTIAEYNWIIFGSGDKLHAPMDWNDPDSWGYSPSARTHCWRTGVGYIPGFQTRMTAERCRICCRNTGMPEGIGSPKNDDACRPLLKGELDD